MSKKVFFASLMVMALLLMTATSAFAWSPTYNGQAGTDADPLAAADLPYYSGVIAWAATGTDLPTACGDLQDAAWVKFTVDNVADPDDDPNFVHISVLNYYGAPAAHYDFTNYGLYDTLGNNIACGTTEGLHPVAAGESYYVVVGVPLFAPAPAAENFELVIAPSVNDGSLIVAVDGTATEFESVAGQASTADAVAEEFDRWVEWAGLWGTTDDAGNQEMLDNAPLGRFGVDGDSDGTCATCTGDERFVFLDIPAGTYNVALYDDNDTGGDNTDAVWGTVLLDVDAPGSAFFDEGDADKYVNSTNLKPWGNNLNTFMFFHPASGLVFNDVPVGRAAGGVHQFRVPVIGDEIDVIGVADKADEAYFLVVEDVNPILGDVDFDLEATPPADVLACYPDNGTGDDYDEALIFIVPPGAAQERAVDMEGEDDKNGDCVANGGPDFEGTVVYLMADTAYSVAPYGDPLMGGIQFEGDSNDFWYIFEATVTDWNFTPANDNLYEYEYEAYLAIAPFDIGITGDVAVAAAPGAVTYSHTAIMGQGGDTLVRVIGDDDEEYSCETGFPLVLDADGDPDEIEPCFGEYYGVLEVYTLFYNSWSDADATTTGIGRRQGEYGIQTGELAEYALFPDGLWYFDQDCFDCQWATTVGEVVEPADVDFGNDWAYHYILTMYELGMTAGVSATEYDPYGGVTRAQMATYIANPFMNPAVAAWKGFPVVVAALPAYGGSFTDVVVGDWFASPVQFMIDNGITAGIGGGLYGSENPVIRGDMAIFLEKAGRAGDSITATTFPFNWAGWNTNLGSPLPLVLNTPGINDGWFYDVPQGSYYGHWAEEAFADGLIFPCDPGEPWVNLGFCPERAVDRSEMAVFMVNSFAFPLGLWPAPAWWGGPVPTP